MPALPRDAFRLTPFRSQEPRSQSPLGSEPKEHSFNKLLICSELLTENSEESHWICEQNPCINPQILCRVFRNRYYVAMHTTNRPKTSACTDSRTNLAGEIRMSGCS